MTFEELEQYHADNPQIYEAFERFTMEAINSGRKYFSSEMIINRMRWYTAIEAKNDIFKINNDLKAFYSRLFENNHPQYKDFFRKRRSIADELLHHFKTESNGQLSLI